MLQIGLLEPTYTFKDARAFFQRCKHLAEFAS